MIEKLEQISKELKEYLRQYDTACMLGHLSFLASTIANGMSGGALDNLSSPQRQLYYIAGLLMSSTPSGKNKFQLSDEEWDKIVEKINAIESEYYKMFLPIEGEATNKEWMKKRQVAMPSFMSFFNQGPLNYEEQTISWIRDVYTPLDTIIEPVTQLRTEDFLKFYESLDSWCQQNFQMFNQLSDIPLRDNWKDYARIQLGIMDEAPEEIKALGEDSLPMYTFVADYGMKNRFYPNDLVTEDLPIDKVEAILFYLSCERQDRDFLFYTSMNPGNPLFDTPIVDIGDGMYQVYEEKQVLHAIDRLLEKVCGSNDANKSKYIKKKGDILEDKIVSLFDKFFKGRATIYRGYYVDGCEQDILVLYRDMALVIEAKAYTMHEPFRDPERAYVRIKRDFNSSIGYANEQLWRVEQKFIEQKPLVLTDENGHEIATIDTTKYIDGDYYIIVNQKSYGQLQVDLSMLLELEEGAHYPWAIRYDDLEVFLLTLMRRKKDWVSLKQFLLNREYLHGRVYCSDELEICGGYLTGNITEEMMQGEDIISCTPSLANMFDEQYRKGLGFRNEKNWIRKKSGDTLFW